MDDKPFENLESRLAMARSLAEKSAARASQDPQDFAQELGSRSLQQEVGEVEALLARQRFERQAEQAIARQRERDRDAGRRERVGVAREIVNMLIVKLVAAALAVVSALELIDASFLAIELPIHPVILLLIAIAVLTYRQILAVARSLFDPVEHGAQKHE